MRTYSKSTWRYAEWINTFDQGTEWISGAFSERCERELIQLGSLVPTGIPGRFTTARVVIK